MMTTMKNNPRKDSRSAAIKEYIEQFKRTCELAKEINTPEYLARFIADMEAKMPLLREKMSARFAKAEAEGDKKGMKACRSIIESFEKLLVVYKEDLALKLA